MGHSFGRILQQIFIWVRNHINLPSVQGHRYTEWDLHRARERRIFIKSSYSDILENVGVPKSNLYRSLNIIFPPLICSYLKHLWDIIVVGKITKIIVREVIEKIVVKNKSGSKTYLLKDEEAYTVATSEIDGAHVLLRDIVSFNN